MSTDFAATLDVRTIPHRDRHSLIFGSFDSLQPGQALQLVNDHDPRPLYFHFESRSPGAFHWAYLEAGPEVWRVEIRKTLSDQAKAEAEDSCCSGGACCG
ncbi:MAG TPA: DUF2249 domain-containing protein [Ideonella sp.]|nr:DUF2249 domain-containing protein [Ideonella sp.]